MLGPIRVERDRYGAKIYSKMSAQTNTTSQKADLVAERTFSLRSLRIMRMVRISLARSGVQLIQQTRCSLTKSELKPEITGVLMRHLYTWMNIGSMGQIRKPICRILGEIEWMIIKRNPNWSSN